MPILRCPRDATLERTRHRASCREGTWKEWQLKDIRSERLPCSGPLQATAIAASIPSSAIAIVALLGVRDDAIAARCADAIDTEGIAATLVIG